MNLIRAAEWLRKKNLELDVKHAEHRLDFLLDVREASGLRRLLARPAAPHNLEGEIEKTRLYLSKYRQQLDYARRSP